MRIGIPPRFPFIFALFSAFLIASLSAKALAESQTWSTYHNLRFGTTADVPQGWRSGPPPANNDGLIFTSQDGTAQLTVSGSLNIQDSLEAAFESYETPEKGETISYKHRAGHAVTLSGTKGDRIFYTKHLLSCRDQIWNSIYLEYPAARKAAFDALVAHVAKSLRPGKGTQIENCDR